MTASQGTHGDEQLPPRRTPEWFAALGFDKPFGLHTANMYERLSFGWGAPLLEKGSYGQITEDMADCLPPPEDEAPLRAQQFAECYDQCQVRVCPCLTILANLVHSLYISREYHAGNGLWVGVDYTAFAAGSCSLTQAMVSEEQPLCQDTAKSILAQDGSSWVLDFG